MSKTISILGATGSIGRQTLDVAEQLGLRVAALTANSNAERLEAQARKFRPRLAVLTDEAAAKDLAVRLADTDIRVLGGPEALLEAAVCPEADTVVTAVVGMVGLKPTLAAIREKKRIALANKETLVCAGQLVMDAADTYGAEIVPVDSEHSAIFQCLQGCADRREIKRLILTCSGGPFYGMTAEEVGKMTRADALRHPNWTMGPKITVDCATLMNKGLEVIEAMHLFQVKPEEIDVVVHPQSIIHSMVLYRDGSVLAQLGNPDMKVPIRLALTYPYRAESPAEELDLTRLGCLTFEKPDTNAFPCLEIALRAAKTGGTMPAVMNGANEAAVSFFLKRHIKFNEIQYNISRVMDRHLNSGECPFRENPSLEEIVEADRWARAAVGGMI